MIQSLWSLPGLSRVYGHTTRSQKENNYNLLVTILYIVTHTLFLWRKCLNGNVCGKGTSCTILIQACGVGVYMKNKCLRDNYVKQTHLHGFHFWPHLTYRVEVIVCLSQIVHLCWNLQMSTRMFQWLACLQVFTTGHSTDRRSAITPLEPGLNKWPSQTN